MALITKRRTLPIKKLVLSLKNVRELASIICDEYEKEKATGNVSASVRFAVNCTDNYFYESEDIAILDDDSDINRQKTESIRINFQSGKERAITLQLKHGNGESDNFIDVAGDDNMWVNGINGRFNDQLKSFRPQQPFLIQFQTRLRWFCFILSTLAFGFVADLINRNTENYTRFWTQAFNNPWDDGIAYLIAAIFLGGGIGIGILNSILQKATELWPSIELQIGPEHLQTEKQKRTTYYSLFTLFIFPIILFVLSLLVSSK